MSTSRATRTLRTLVPTPGGADVASYSDVELMAGTNVTLTTTVDALGRAQTTVASSGGGASPSGSVVSETSFGAASSAGSAATYSRGDHTHGTPAAPTAASVGADPAGTAAGLVATEAATRAAADTALAAPDYIVRTSTATLAAERVLTDGTEVTWDWSVGGIVKAVIPVALRALAALTPAADKLPYFDGASSAALTSLTATARSLLALTLARGDLYIASAAATISALTIGGAGTALRSDGTDPSWQTVCPAVFGDGSDGTVTFDGSSTVLGMAPSGSVYTLTRDLLLSSATINAGVQLKTAGFAIFVANTLTFTDATSVIQWDGTAASGASAGGFVSGGTIGQNGSGAGAAGRSTTGAGAAGGGLSNSVSGAGGAGGTAGGANAGGAGGSPTAPTAATGSYRHLGFVMRGWRLIGASAQGASQSLGMGIGGGAGGCDVSGGGTASSGGGGGGAGFVAVAARLIVGAGTIRATGGAGGNAVQTGAGKAGGGGGGGGGMVDVTSTTRTLPCTLSAAGGAGGTGANGGASGSAGSTGTTIARII